MKALAAIAGTLANEKRWFAVFQLVPATTAFDIPNSRKSRFVSALEAGEDSMRDHVTRRPMPTEQAIQWGPLRDPHYVVASLQPTDGGRRKIFVRQQVITRVETLVRTHGRRTVGLLLGQLYQCSVTGANYLVIESISDHDIAADETEVAAKVAEALAERASEHRTGFLGSGDSHVVGWYRGVHSIEAKPSLSTASVHVSLFPEPWQMTLVVAEGANPDGAFFLRDNVNSCWFSAPFYELLSHAATPNEPKATVVNWPQCITAEPVIRAERVIPAASDLKPQVESRGLADVRPTKVYERPWLRRSPTKHNGMQAGHIRERDVAPASPPPEASPSSAPVSAAADAAPESQADLTVPKEPAADHPVADLSLGERPVADRPVADRPVAHRPLADRPAPRSVEPGFADAPPLGRERTPLRRSGRLREKLSIVDDRDQRSAGPSGARRIADDDDTALDDDAGRYIEIARAEGFFIAARFDAAGEPGGVETLWVLNEPYSGMLLAVVAANSQVIDATLHYNLQTDDAGLKNAPFPEHRDPESKTIYVRETCMDYLRARCRRLRATNALVRVWKVAPTISLLTPGEWESIPLSGAPADRGVHAIDDLNKARIAELPAGVRSQFHLSADEAGEAGA